MEFELNTTPALRSMRLRSDVIEELTKLILRVKG